MITARTFRRALLSAAILSCMTITAVAQNLQRLPAQPENVDLELVLAVDISLSMDLEEQRLQRDGYVAALRDPQVIKAIGSGPQGRIALSYIEWAGTRIQRVVVPWRIVSDAANARAFADELSAKPVSRARMTSISSAIIFSAKHFRSSGVTSLRRVIDVSGDGPNNSGQLVLEARKKVLDQGIIINGLAIQIPRARFSAYSYFDIDDLKQYYADCVIGGPNSFALVIRSKPEFATAIRQKLLLEIAGSTPALFHRAQFMPPQQGAPGGRLKSDCEIGEKRWQNYLLDQE
ncbi:MAG TPA: DUF1194 domain-containing protein [Hyphomicrobiaceae bacterium]|nr:DUF1194 domain-containing protein [Hyphomicrobiaceae bacterium]